MRDLLFFIGTEAELMKMYIVIKKAKERGWRCKIVSSGQNDIRNSLFLDLCDSQIDIDLSKYAPTKKNGRDYLEWLIKTCRYGQKILQNEYKGKKKPIMIIHGDTLSTLLGARIAKKAGLRFCHVEGGWRSYNWLNPFPEEIDRYFSSKNADLIFCASSDATITAEKSFKGKAINTVVNTNYEVLKYALEYNAKRENPVKTEEKYFVAAIHRQENLLNRDFMEKTTAAILSLSKRMKCVFIYHIQTKNTLERYGLFERLEKNENIILLERLNYFDFIKVVNQSEFLLADGAGNQQEMYYLGKPYLILRGHIECKSEGLGDNARGFDGKFDEIEAFDREYKRYIRKPLEVEESPSEIILNSIAEYYRFDETTNANVEK